MEKNGYVTTKTMTTIIVTAVGIITTLSAFFVGQTGTLRAENDKTKEVIAGNISRISVLETQYKEIDRKLQEMKMNSDKIPEIQANLSLLLKTFNIKR